MRTLRVIVTAVSVAVLFGAAAYAQGAPPPAREAFDSTLLPSNGLLRLGNGTAILADGPVQEGQVFLSIPVRHTLSGMSSEGREVDVVYRNGRRRGRPDRPSDVLPTPAPFYLAMLSDRETGTPVFWWCTPGEGLRAGPMCTGGNLDSGVATGRSSVGSMMIENHGNPFMPTSLRYRTCVRGCSTAWMHHFTLQPNNRPVRDDLTLEYVLGARSEDGARTIERRLGGEPFDTFSVHDEAELRTAAGAITFVPEEGGVRARLRPFTERERARSLAIFGATFRTILAARNRTAPGMVASAGDPAAVALEAAVFPMTQVFAQPVTLPGNDMPFPEGEGPVLFVDYVGAVGDAWDSERSEFRPRYAWFVFGYARHTGGRWHALVPMDGADGGSLVLAGQRLLQVTAIDADGAATIQVVGGVPAEPMALTVAN